MIFLKAFILDELTAYCGCADTLLIICTFGILMIILSFVKQKDLEEVQEWSDSIRL
jgi:hypothetical protein